VHLDAGVGADRIAGFGAACAEALNGPADLFAVHVGEIAGVGGGESSGGCGLVVGCGVFEDSDVAALGCDDLEPRFVGGTAEEDLVRERCAFFRSGGVAGEVEHPTGEDVGEFDEVGRHGMAMVAHDVDALPYFDPVAGESAQRFVVIGEEGDGVGAGGFAGLNHELGEELRLIVGGHEGAAADFDVEDEGVEVFGELFAHDAGADEEGGLDGAGVVAEGVKDAVSGDKMRGLSDKGCAAFFEGEEKLVEGELSLEARDGFELVKCAAGMAEASAGDHGHADSRDACSGWRGKAGCGEDGGNEEGGLVAHAAGGVLVDGEGVE